MGIDLGGFYSAGPTAGAMVAEFGRDISSLSMALARRGRYSQTQQSFLSLQSAKEVIAAKDAYYTSINEFNKQLDTNLDYESQPEAWDKHNATTMEKIQSGMTLEESKLEFGKWAVGEKDKQADHVYAEVRKKTVASAQATGLVAIQNRAEQGDEEGLLAMGPELIRGGIYDGSEAMSLIKEWLPKARYNKVYKELNASGDYDAAVAELLDPGAGDKFRLDPAQLEDMIADFLYKSDTIQKQSEKIQERDGKAAWDEYLEKDANDSFESLAERQSYIAKVDKGHQETVRRETEEWKKLYGASPQQRITTTQDVYQNHLLAQAWEWATNGAPDSEAPFTAEGLGEQLVSQGGEPPKLRPEQLTAIRSALKDAEKAHESGSEVSALYSRLYSAVDGNRNPAMEVSIREIDETVKDPSAHQGVLAKRNELQNSYESGRGATKESVLLEGYDIVFHPSRSVADKQKWVDEKTRAGGGLSAEDGKKLRSWIDPYNEDPKRKEAMDAINDAYKITMSNKNNSIAVNKELALELYNARNVVMKLFESGASQPEIDKTVEGFLSKKAVQDLEEIIKQAGLEGIGFSTGEIRGKYREATIAEYLQEQGQLTGKPAAEFPQELRAKSEQLEQDTLRKANIRAEFTTRLASGKFAGQLVYSTKPIAKGATGKLLMSGTGAQGVLYQVRYQIKNEEYVPTVYIQNPDTGEFDVIDWEWQ